MIRGRAGAASLSEGVNGPNQHAVGPSLLQLQVQVPGPGPGPSSKGRREGQEGAGGPSSQLGGKIQQLCGWRVRTAVEGLEVLLQAEILWCGCVNPVTFKYPTMLSNLRPSELGVKGQGRDSVRSRGENGNS